MNQILHFLQYGIILLQSQRNKIPKIEHYSFKNFAIDSACAFFGAVLSAVMDILLELLTPAQLIGAICVALIAGLVKGLVGFAMPMILISGTGSFIAPELALAGLIVPTLATNGIQALRQGPRAAANSVVRYKVFLLAMIVLLFFSAQLVRVLPLHWLLLIIGAPITLFAVLQLAGVPIQLRRGPSPRTEAVVGGFAGFFGGLSGVWGPPTVAYLTALNVEKREHVRVQGVIYGIGSVALFGAHIGSGVLNAQTICFSLALVPPSVLAMYVGGQIQDRIDQVAFRRATLFVLLIAGLNLLRRGVFS